MTPAQLRALDAAATPGPWDSEGSNYIFAKVPGGRPNGEGIAQMGCYTDRNKTDQCEHRREVERLDAENAALRAQRAALLAAAESRIQSGHNDDTAPCRWFFRTNPDDPFERQPCDCGHDDLLAAVRAAKENHGT
jgi:hypothetical protein